MILLPHPAYAQEFYNWKVDVELQENGDGLVKNTWIAKETKGTEKYLPIENLGDSKILNFKVSDNGTPLEPINNWDSDRSREEKAGKSGILKTNNGLELVFGVGEYGDHKYEFEYTVTNMVKALEDGQSLYWRFINDKLSTPPEEIEITVKGFKPFTKDDVNMWSFGYPGEVVLDESTGEIKARSSESLKSSHFATLLLQFPENYFNTSSSLNKTQEELREQAFEGSDYGREEENSSTDRFFEIIGLLFIGLSVIAAPFAIIAGVRSYRSSAWMRKLTKEYKSREKMLEKEYFRELPYTGAFSNLSHILGYTSFFTKENIITAFLLKWIKEGAIEFKSSEKGSIIKREEVSMLFHKSPSLNTASEKEFYNLLMEAADGKNRLEEEDLKKYFKKNYVKYDNFFMHLEGHSVSALTEEGYLEEREDGGHYKYKMNVLTDSGQTLLDKNIMFKNYLEEYSLLNERDSYNVHLWEDYLINAAIYGIAEEVYKEFETLEPGFQNDTVFYPYYIHHSYLYSSAIQSSYDSARSAGSGGSSSIGGGGGSFGGGSGGGTR